MILTEYDEDFNNKTWYEDGVEDGILKGKIEDAENLLKMRLGNVERIALATKLPIEQIQELQKKILINA